MFFIFIHLFVYLFTYLFLSWEGDVNYSDGNKYLKEEGR